MINIDIDNLIDDTYKLLGIFQNFENEYTAFSSNYLNGFSGGEDSVIIQERMMKNIEGINEILVYLKNQAESMYVIGTDDFENMIKVGVLSSKDLFK